MRIVLDTNVFISGIFFSGPPSKILKAWGNQSFQIVLSQQILECAVAGKCKTIISGDKHLLKLTGYQGITVLNPRNFVDKYL